MSERPDAWKRFDGEQYKYSGGSGNHQVELSRAERIRKGGYKARVVKEKGMWCIYVRKGPYKSWGEKN